MEPDTSSLSELLDREKDSESGGGKCCMEDADDDEEEAWEVFARDLLGRGVSRTRLLYDAVVERASGVEGT